MRISHFFIDRPIFASVLSIVIVIIGAVTFMRLPVAQYPEIAPPVINITGQYPGASAEIVAETVVAPIEQQVNGVEGMLYISSNSTSDGRFSISVTFDIGIDLDTAQVQVQNRVATATPRLPQQVQQIGVTVAKSSPDILMLVNLLSPDGSRDPLFISNYANLQIRDQLTRVDGRRLDHHFRRARLRHADLARSGAHADAEPDGAGRDPGAAGAERPGRLGRAQPAAGRPNQLAFQVAVRTLGRLSDPEEFGKIVVKQTSERRGAAARRRAHRTGGAGLFVDLLSQRRPVGGAGGVPAARIQRADHRRQYPHGGRGDGARFSAGDGTPDPLRSDPVHPPVRRRR